MYHFTFIDEASTENEPLNQESLNSEKQDFVSENKMDQPENETNLIKKTAHFLHRYLD